MFIPLDLLILLWRIYPTLRTHLNVTLNNAEEHLMMVKHLGNVTLTKTIDVFLYNFFYRF